MFFRNFIQECPAVLEGASTRPVSKVGEFRGVRARGVSENYLCPEFAHICKIFGGPKTKDVEAAEQPNTKEHKSIFRHTVTVSDAVAAFSNTILEPELLPSVCSSSPRAPPLPPLPRPRAPLRTSSYSLSISISISLLSLLASPFSFLSSPLPFTL